MKYYLDRSIQKVCDLPACFLSFFLLQGEDAYQGQEEMLFPDNYNCKPSKNNANLGLAVCDVNVYGKKHLEFCIFWMHLLS